MRPRTDGDDDVTLTAADKRRRARVHPTHREWKRMRTLLPGRSLDTRRVRERFTKTGLRRLGGGSRVSPQRALSLVPLRRFLSENAAAIESRARVVCSPRALVAPRLPPRHRRERFAIVLDYKIFILLSQDKNSTRFRLLISLPFSVYLLARSRFLLPRIAFSFLFLVSLLSPLSLLFSFRHPLFPPLSSSYPRTRFDRVRECVRRDRIAFRARGFWTPFPENSAVRRTGVRR